MTPVSIKRMSHWTQTAALAACLALGVGGLAYAVDDQAEEKAIQAGTGELKGLEDRLKATKAREKSLGDAISALERETRVLSERLISMAARVQAREAKITSGEERLVQLDLEERAHKDQLRRRRKTLADLLAGLQRLEQNPPPALIVKPNDALAALRSAMLLGAIVPELKAEATAISRNLSRLVDLRSAIQRERKGLESNVARLLQEREEIETLLSKKQAMSAKTRNERKEYKRLAASLSGHAKNLRSLIGALEKKRKQRLRAEQKLAEKLAKEQLAAEERIKLEEKRRLAVLKAPRTRFSRSHSKISYPAQGERLYTYGDKKPDGTMAKGVALATRSNAQVTAPADGTVVYAEEFRSYGRLLIINAGEGYHLLLAGLGTISVSAGQTVRAGEPIGTMGEKAASGVVGSGADLSRPILYVEFRRNGNSIDSRPWWAGSSSKVRG
ncbi:MAG: peptidoglycan DD-metalloendopeptidase family protein [Alphaproteobacteria bacterium]|nr:peptidoglycan DD-metalloendopeptidase family protein [Alphaproteobacteria bacterium]